MPEKPLKDEFSISIIEKPDLSHFKIWLCEDILLYSDKKCLFLKAWHLPSKKQLPNIQLKDLLGLQDIKRTKNGLLLIGASSSQYQLMQLGEPTDKISPPQTF